MRPGLEIVNAGLASVSNAEFVDCGVSIQNANTALVDNIRIIESSRISCEKLRYVLSNHIESNDRDEQIDCLNEILKADRKKIASPIYDRFVSLAANHMTILAQFIPALQNIVNGLS
jgi:hypothetical protein